MTPVLNYAALLHKIAIDAYLWTFLNIESMNIVHWTLSRVRNVHLPLNFFQMFIQSKQMLLSFDSGLWLNIWTANEFFVHSPLNVSFQCSLNRNQIKLLSFDSGLGLNILTVNRIICSLTIEHFFLMLMQVRGFKGTQSKREVGPALAVLWTHPPPRPSSEQPASQRPLRSGSQSVSKDYCITGRAKGDFSV